MADGPSIVWLRDDLRLSDNPALTAAVDRGTSVIVVYLLDEESPGIRPLGGASKWWLHHSLTRLADSLDAIGGALVLRRGAAAVEIPRLVAETGAGAVFWNRRYAASRTIDAALKILLREQGLEVQSFQANLLFEPWTVTTGEGNPYRVFTPFWRACNERGGIRAALPAPTALPSGSRPSAGPDAGAPFHSDPLDSWALLPTRPDWSAGLRESHTPGESGALARLEEFATGHLDSYDRRDFPAEVTTSGLSPHLRFGEVSPFQVWERLGGNAGRPDLDNAARKNAAGFLREIGWREFCWHILFHFPSLATVNFRPAFDDFPWEKPRQFELEAWQQGRTGIPLVDAGMRELWHTGTMHNRVRMVTASFLVKNLLIDWRVGEAWFWDTLVDADEASNPANWQWVAGSGADAAPYFRVFNPELQAKKFDVHGRYLRRWIGELDSGEYPEPIVDLARSRRDALAAYEALKAAQRD
ncbi:MAG: cryptochrome/photolyase family protein [Microbacteriaceae bacterium]